MPVRNQQEQGLEPDQVTTDQQWYQITSGGLHGRKEGNRFKYYGRGDKILLTASEAKSQMLRGRIEKSEGSVPMAEEVPALTVTEVTEEEDEPDSNISPDSSANTDFLKGWESVVAESSVKDLTELIESMTDQNDLKLIRQAEAGKHNRAQVLATIDKQLQPQPQTKKAATKMEKKQ